MSRNQISADEEESLRCRGNDRNLLRRRANASTRPDAHRRVIFIISSMDDECSFKHDRCHDAAHACCPLLLLLGRTPVVLFIGGHGAQGLWETPLSSTPFACEETRRAHASGRSRTVLETLEMSGAGPTTYWIPHHKSREQWQALARSHVTVVDAKSLS